MARHPETQYLDLLERVLHTGDKRIDRTGVGTFSSLGAMMRFDLSDGDFPVFTTKRVYWKLAVKEMIWFLTGDTNIRPLLAEGVRIWSDWPLATYRRQTGEQISQQAFESRILNDESFARKWGDLGPVYGKQWRAWVAADGRTYDQVATLINDLRTNPSSRRLIFHAWNVGELSSMALAPCHMVYQFHVSGIGSQPRLNLMVFQRSCDLFLGLPFNICQQAALVHMIAQQVGMPAGELVWSGGDVHIYSNHVEQVTEQMAREPRPFPKLTLLRRAADINDFKIGDFQVSGYDPHAPIAGDVAV
ncbi:thymidylate synthase [Rhizobium indigoferae]|uniref:Thymidylate synthase n=1 Tax=Rhizobium indigoferae TaxID=158891 RepID=A0ABZ0ZDQ6_9HYPH|nr:thymidylate synthase [Rhizobium indigoferae]NNU56118.1 thymidylate synthase [Rhizobium indigoferae]WQN37761.1 thymidylate synthase [Rhizobium indigoferae]GLR59360.1 thymidylate synthase [Rhizobium indigoferae]